ncbi:UNKNOWN [Stylonychia lemnae]|uniref:Uncharacterized protein n=1 Tax=Stylonychia lemnae TaxID=5949 RepID=A0A078B348_STYLE|nr:UNKNOWN [Stylonychia lemnae]|eukprot:CDW87908.1 UNKNOWN [Stylonychia lemnae]
MTRSNKRRNKITTTEITEIPHAVIREMKCYFKLCKKIKDTSKKEEQEQIEKQIDQAEIPIWLKQILRADLYYRTDRNQQALLQIEGFDSDQWRDEVSNWLHTKIKENTTKSIQLIFHNSKITRCTVMISKILIIQDVTS